ncbi:MAG: Hpt domain-containing protein, partial [Pseudomonadota bacterium]|nr:Hpt domain-containing protein [Pseudomonadota bacterium]
VRFNSHAMKGVSGDVGADAIREKASSIENKAKQDDLSEIVQDIAELDSLIKQTIAAMKS